MLFNKIPELTVGLSIKNNMAAAKLCLATLLTGTRLPQRIQLRIESDFPEFDDYYFAQLTELARLADVAFSIDYCKSVGINGTRQWHVDNCRTRYILFLDDDVIVRHDCLQRLEEALIELTEAQQRLLISLDVPPWIYIQGCKGDLNNRRGYGNFVLTEQNEQVAENSLNFNFFYDPEKFSRRVPLFELKGNDPRADPGCLLVDLVTFKVNDMSFVNAETYTNAGGEDVLFALECAKRKLRRWFAPKATAFHLEKPFQRMSTFAYYKAYTMRTAEKLGLPTDEFGKLLPWEPIYTFPANKP